MLKYRSNRPEIISVVPPLTVFPLSLARANLNRWSILGNHLDCSLPFLFPAATAWRMRVPNNPTNFVKFIRHSCPYPHRSCFLSSTHVRLPKIRQLSIHHAFGIVMDIPSLLGKESSLFVPSLPFISSPCPYGTLPQPLRRSLTLHRIYAPVCL